MQTKTTFNNIVGSPPTKSVLTLTAPNIILCASSTSPEQVFSDSVLAALDNSHLSTLDKAVIEVLFLNGCRISELLQISSRDIKSNGFIKISGLKKSNNRILITSQYSTFWQFCKKQNVEMFYGITRFYYYRLFKKLNITFITNNSSKMAVTHSFRHNLLRSITENVEELKMSASFIGQRNIESTKSYVNVKKGK